MSQLTRRNMLSTNFCGLLVNTLQPFANAQVPVYAQNRRRPLRTIVYNIRKALRPVQPLTKADVSKGYGVHYKHVTQSSKRGAWPKGTPSKSNNPLTIAHESFHRLNFDIGNMLKQSKCFEHLSIPYSELQQSGYTPINSGFETIYMGNGYATVMQDVKSVTIDEIAKHMPEKLVLSDWEIQQRELTRKTGEYVSDTKYEAYFYRKEEWNKKAIRKGGAPQNIGMFLIEEMAATETETEIVAAMELHDKHPFYDQIFYHDGIGKKGFKSQASLNGYFFMHVALATASAVESHKDDYHSEQEYKNVLSTIKVLFERLVRAREKYLDQERYPKFLDTERRTYDDFLKDAGNAHLVESASRIYGEDWLEGLKIKAPEPIFIVKNELPKPNDIVDFQP